MKIGFIGTRLMGFLMAQNLLQKKIYLKVFSRTLEKAKPLEEFGAVIKNSLGSAVAEEITLCEKSGVDANKFVKALKGGFADGKILQNHGKKMIDKDFSPKGKVSTHLKDMNNILECANNFNTALPISKLIKEMFNSLAKNGNQNDDHSALYKEIERLNKK